MDKNSFDLKSARRSLSTFFLVLFLASSDMFAQEALPKGSHPPAIVFDHFPNRMFAFVWRNWNLVQPERMAKTIQCDVKDIFAIAASMGLPAASPVSEAFKKHSYITVLRRNWHLLPYDQLLTLLDMSSQSLEFALKEDDFLFHKFGNLKPACLPLAYSHPDEKAWARAREIKLSAVPWIPALDLVTEHAANLAKVDTDGLMLSWTLGGYPSPNLEVVQRFNDNADADPDAVLQAVAVGRYGEKAAPFVRSAWTSFSNAFEEFPYNIRTLYSGPQQYGPANLLYAKPTGYRSSMVGFPYDDIDGWRGPYPAEVLVDQYRKVAEGWKDGLGHFNKAVEVSDLEKKEVAYSDWRIAKAAYLHFASSANQGRFILLRNAMLKNDAESERKETLKKINALLDEEVQMATELFEISREDSRIGFEASNQYYYVPQDLMEKVINCEYVRKLY